MTDHETELSGEAREAGKALLCSRKAESNQGTGSFCEVKGQVRGCEGWERLGSGSGLLGQHCFQVLWQHFFFWGQLLISLLLGIT